MKTVACLVGDPFLAIHFWHMEFIKDASSKHIGLGCKDWTLKVIGNQHC